MFDKEGKFKMRDHGLMTPQCCINKTVNFQGLNTSLMRQFSKIYLNHRTQSDDEDQKIYEEGHKKWVELYNEIFLSINKFVSNPRAPGDAIKKGFTKE